MARCERPRVTGLRVHIIQRGNNRQACFYAEADYQFYLHHLSNEIRSESYSPQTLSSFDVAPFRKVGLPRLGGRAARRYLFVLDDVLGHIREV